MWIPSLLLLQRMAAALTQVGGSGAAVGPLEAVYFGLYTAPTGVLTPQSVITDITEATFVGYARIEAVWEAPYFGAAGLEYLESQNMRFTATNGNTPNVITGFFVADALTAGNLLFSAPLPVPGIPMGSAGASFSNVTRFGLDSTGNWGDYSTLS